MQFILRLENIIQASDVIQGSDNFFDCCIAGKRVPHFYNMNTTKFKKKLWKSALTRACALKNFSNYPTIRHAPLATAMIHALQPYSKN